MRFGIDSGQSILTLLFTDYCISALKSVQFYRKRLSLVEVGKNIFWFDLFRTYKNCRHHR